MGKSIKHKHINNMGAVNRRQTSSGNMNPPLPGTSLSDQQARKATGQTDSLAHKEWLAEVKRVESCSSLTHDGPWFYFHLRVQAEGERGAIFSGLQWRLKVAPNGAQGNFQILKLSTMANNSQGHYRIS